MALEDVPQQPPPLAADVDPLAALLAEMANEGELGAELEAIMQDPKGQNWLDARGGQPQFDCSNRFQIPCGRHKDYIP